MKLKKEEIEEGSSVPFDESGQVMHIGCGHFGCRDRLFQMQATEGEAEMINRLVIRGLMRQDKDCRPVRIENWFEAAVKEEKKSE